MAAKNILYMGPETQKALRVWLSDNFEAAIAEHIDLDGAVQLLLKAKGGKTTVVETKKKLGGGLKGMIGGAVDSLGKFGSNVNKNIEQEFGGN